MARHHSSRAVGESLGPSLESSRESRGPSPESSRESQVLRVESCRVTSHTCRVLSSQMTICLRNLMWRVIIMDFIILLRGGGADHYEICSSYRTGQSTIAS